MIVPRTQLRMREIIANVVLPTTMLLLFCYKRRSRAKMRREIVRHRLAWEEHAQSLRSESQFKRYYRMSYESFEKLLMIVSPFLDVDHAQALRRTSGRPPLSKAGQLQACLRWLAGGSALDLRIIAGVSKSSFYRILHRVLDAINEAAQLSIKFPLTAGELAAAERGFASKSTQGLLRGCVGAIDGWLCPVRVPRKNECGRVDSFYSGHYHRYGLNVQACTDCESRFTAFTVSCPGGMNDALAFKKWSLCDVLEQLAPGYFVVADNAYSQTVKVMTPYNKAEIKGREDRDNYNFYLSQLRIRVEMAFGLLVNKWRILKAPLTVRLKACAKVIGACMRLHNFCINERLLEGPVETLNLLHELRRVNSDNDISYEETVEHRRDQSPPDREQESDEEDYEEVSDTEEEPIDSTASIVFGEIARTRIVEHIESMNMHRPAQNTARRADEDQQV